MSWKKWLDRHPVLKQRLHWIMVPRGEARPRWWVRKLLNPWIHHKGKGARIRRRARQDLMPFQAFSIGKKAVVEDFATLNNGVGPLHIGEESWIGIGNVLIGPLSIGNKCILAQNIVISGLNHSYEDPHRSIKEQPVLTDPITIGDHCWIGANVSIMAGVNIGKHVVIGAGSVVTRSVPDYHLAVGNPARLIKRFDFSTKTWVKISA